MRDDRKTSLTTSTKTVLAADQKIPNLEAISISQGLRLAAIDRSIYQEGDTMTMSDGKTTYRIIAIETARVVIEGEPGRIDLSPCPIR